MPSPNAAGLATSLLPSAKDFLGAGPFRLAGYAQNAMMPIQIPGIGDIWDSVLRGSLTPDKAIPLWLANGMLPPTDSDLLNPFRVTGFGEIDVARTGSQNCSPWTAFARNRVLMPSPGELLALVNRNVVTLDFAQHCLRRSGFANRLVRDAILSLRNVIPGPSDLIRFVIREAFNEDAVRQLGLDREYDQNPDFPFWAARQGLGPVKVPDGKGGFKEIDFARLYWRSHWNLPSPTQAYEMLHRLRRGRTSEFKVGDVEPQVFTTNDLNNLLKASDYAPNWRIPLAAVAYRLPGRIDLRRLFNERVIKASDYQAGLEDLGYTSTTAFRLVQLEIDTANRKAYGAVQRLARKDIKRALYLGIVDDAEALKLLEEYGLAVEDARRALSKIKLEMSLDRAQRAITSIKKRFQEGLLDAGDANSQLLVAGVRPEGVRRLFNEWTLEMEGGRRQLSAEKAQDALRRRLISVDNFVLRMKNLGYPDSDIEILLGVVLQDVQQTADSQRQKAASAAKAGQRELERLLRETQAELRRRQKQILVHGTPPRLQRWVQLGLMPYALAKGRLTRAGWTPDDADRLLREPLAKAVQKASQDASQQQRQDSEDSPEGQGESAGP